ncbi:hypothetical protein CORC01_08187 [Colletotrichum orchidophilum]|uniref:Uncharacterized protein n=1 Tax=Colletotrichum orchidophilum TaxID=1209926 RepID=A0A1G4B577_9PEZI|nr:uncharacterized protein CORC01_08187 [Colletotrichum orchidophilum]OHE96589.1 hypothetical protein CORC01_08187 [Colletotrichum orchidophilum]
MYVSSPRRRRAVPPNPIRIRRHANSPLSAGRSPVPWTPDQPTPPTGRSAEFSTFPVSPASPAMNSATTDEDWSPPPSAESTDSVKFTGWRRADGRRGAVGISAGVLPKTYTSTPVVGRSGSVLAGGRIGVSKLSSIQEFLYSPGLSGSPRSWRWWKGEGYRRISKIDEEEESESETDSDEGMTPDWKLERVQRRRTLGFKTCVCHGGSRAESLLWWRYPLVVLLLALFCMFVPYWKGRS